MEGGATAKVKIMRDGKKTVCMPSSYILVGLGLRSKHAHFHAQRVTDGYPAELVIRDLHSSSGHKNK
jgi:hypothetical protein